MEQQQISDPSQHIDYWRQAGFFDPCSTNVKVTVVGAGAIGSHLVDILANMGVRDITVYDFDKVEPHNLPNQAFLPCHIGMPKVEALKRLVYEKTGVEIVAHDMKVESLENLEGYLVVCPDSLTARKQIVLSSARMNRKVPRVIDVRMGLQYGRVYSIDPCNRNHLESWVAETKPEDDDTISNPCNMIAIASTAHVLAAMAANQIIAHTIGNEKIPHNCWMEIQMYGRVDASEWNKTQI